MAELFSLKIASKRQVTIPQRFMNLLDLQEGDELQVEVTEHGITLTPYVRVRSDMFTPQIKSLLEKRERELQQEGVSLGSQKVASKGKAKVYDEVT